MARARPFNLNLVCWTSDINALHKTHEKSPNNDVCHICPLCSWMSSSNGKSNRFIPNLSAQTSTTSVRPTLRKCTTRAIFPS